MKVINKGSADKVVCKWIETSKQKKKLVLFSKVLFSKRSFLQGRLDQ